jgi:hypothetical protein
MMVRWIRRFSMPRFLAFRSFAGVALGDEEAKPQYRLVCEDDIKRGIFIAASDPNIAREASYEVEAWTLKEAEEKLAEKLEQGMF